MIKYIHSSADTLQFNGVTIAYEVFTTHIKFAYSVVRKPDQYNKKIGRNITTERFNTSVTNFAAVKSLPYHIDTKRMFGYITKECLLERIGVYNCFNKNIISSIELNDIKTSTLISIITGVVAEHSHEFYCI